MIFVSCIINRHGDRTIAKAQKCWPNDTAVWNCSLAAAATATVKHDQHSLAVNRIYRKGTKFQLDKLIHINIKRVVALGNNSAQCSAKAEQDMCKSKLNRDA